MESIKLHHNLLNENRYDCAWLWTSHSSSDFRYKVSFTFKRMLREVYPGKCYSSGMRTLARLRMNRMGCGRGWKRKQWSSFSVLLFASVISLSRSRTRGKRERRDSRWAHRGTHKSITLALHPKSSSFHCSSPGSLYPSLSLLIQNITGHLPTMHWKRGGDEKTESYLEYNDHRARKHLCTVIFFLLRLFLPATTIGTYIMFYLEIILSFLSPSFLVFILPLHSSFSPSATNVSAEEFPNCPLCFWVLCCKISFPFISRPFHCLR